MARPLSISRSAPAAWTLADPKNQNILILALDLQDVCVAEVSVQDRIILIWSRQDVLYAKGPVSKPNVLRRRGITLAPATGDFDRFMHWGCLCRM